MHDFRFFLLALLVVLSACSDSGRDAALQEPDTIDIDFTGRNAYAGSESCRACHPDIYASFIRTAHHNSSRPARPENILGSFASAHNRVRIADDVEVHMKQRDSLCFQVGVYGDEEGSYKVPHQFDIVVGSGRKGQTYLYWKDSLLYQLPISYYSVSDEWVISPGYKVGELNFRRQVSTRCVECHGTYFEASTPWDIARMLTRRDFDAIDALDPTVYARLQEYNLNAFNPDNYILGISCEKCHGPAAAHVAFHQAQPEETRARHIINTAAMERRRQVDLCAWCHSGTQDIVRAPFTYRPGQALDSFMLIDYHVDVNELDVHGNQVGLLMQSRCFQASDDMSCSTCHDVHQRERDDLTVFSQRCQSCHGQADCGMQSRLPSKINQNCIDCHMPNRQSHALVVQASAETRGVDVRTHYIAIYPEESEAILQNQHSH